MCWEGGGVPNDFGMTNFLFFTCNSTDVKLELPIVFSFFLRKMQVRKMQKCDVTRPMNTYAVLLSRILERVFHQIWRIQNTICDVIGKVMQFLVENSISYCLISPYSQFALTAKFVINIPWFVQRLSDYTYITAYRLARQFGQYNHGRRHRGGGGPPQIFPRLTLCLWAVHGKNRLQMVFVPPIVAPWRRP